MDYAQLTYPDGYSEPSEPLQDRYAALIWHNGEVCNECFTQIRSIGELREKRTALGVHEFNAHYERTEHGSQEYDPFSPPSSRYGRCYCLECGSDTQALHDRVDTETLLERGKRVVRYITTETDAAIDGEAMGRALNAFKSIKSNQRHNPEIMAVATIVGLERADADTQTPKATA